MSRIRPYRREPPTLAELVEAIRRALPSLRARYHVRSLWLFGSYVRGEPRPRSDLDILVEFEETPTLFEFGALEDELAALTGLKVDLVSAGALRGAIGERIVRERVLV